MNRFHRAYIIYLFILLLILICGCLAIKSILPPKPVCTHATLNCYTSQAADDVFIVCYTDFNKIDHPYKFDNYNKAVTLYEYLMKRSVSYNNLEAPCPILLPPIKKQLIFY